MGGGEVNGGGGGGCKGAESEKGGLGDQQGRLHAWYGLRLMCCGGWCGVLFVVVLRDLAWL